MLLTVGHLTHCPLVSIRSRKCLDRGHCHITEDILTDILVLEVGLNLILHILLLRFFFGIHHATCRVGARAIIHLFLTQVPEVNFSIVDSSGQLVDIWQILETLDEIIDEPRGMLCTIGDVLFALLVSCDFLFFAAIWPLNCLVLIRNVVRVHRLRLVIEGKEQLNVPGEDCTLGTS